MSRLRLQEVSKEYMAIFGQHEAFWKQRAKQHWLLYSYTNSHYFHVAASARKKQNSFSQLKDGNGDWRVLGVMDWTY